MKKFKILIFIVLIIFILGIIFFSVDYNRVKQKNKPLFCIKYGTLLDGGTTEYLGLGYKVIDFHKLLPVDQMTEENQYYDDIKIGSWFMKYEDFESEYNNY